jgi:hypothetical protein
MMHSNRVLFQNNTNTTNAAPRINSLMSRMLGVDATSSSVNNTLTENNCNNAPAIKRNLFGIRLNHDQLKDDLKEMWREQVERQKVKWNFDFETLKPLADTTNQKKSINTNIKTNQKSNNEENSKKTTTNTTNSGFKWVKVKTLDINGQENNVKAAAAAVVTPTPKAKINIAKTNATSSSKPSGLGEYAKTTLDQRELKIARQRVMPRNSKNFNIFNDFKQQSQSQHNGDVEEEEEEEEEEDEALAVPQFYKYQRRLKINEEKNRIDYMSLLMAPPAPSSASASTAATTTNSNFQQQKQQQETPVRVRLSLSPIAKAKSPKYNKSTTTTPTSTKSPSLNSSKTFEPIFKFAITKSSSTPTTQTTAKASSKKLTINTDINTSLTLPCAKVGEPVIQRPKPIKRTHTSQLSSLALSPSTQNLIITFSENRKDTLRSAAQQQQQQQHQQVSKTSMVAPSVGTSSSRSTHHQIIQKRTQKVLKPKRTKQQIKASALSAFTSTKSGETLVATASALKTNLNDKMKQQSLLDLFKQRKRRNSQSKNDILNAPLAQKTSVDGHFLRSSHQNTATTSTN